MAANKQHYGVLSAETLAFRFRENGTAFLICLLLCCSFLTHAQSTPQVSVKIDTASIRIGEQITYQIDVVTDSTDLVVFPEGQTFSPLEMFESYDIDSVRTANRFKLIKQYALTQFDSGSYTIPAQRVIINDQTFTTDSMGVEVDNVVVDTTEQGLYDIKDSIAVESGLSKFWGYLKWILPLLLVIGAFLYWLIRRNRRQAEAERKLPPFEQAMFRLQELDNKHYLEESKIKDYYSELTDAVRNYLDEEVYDRSLESTTGELIEHLRLEKDAGRVNFDKQTIDNLAQILRTADLAKFARINPDAGKARADRSVVEEVIKETKEALPEPTVEELMQDEAYREAQAQKRQRKFIITGVLGILGILILAGGLLIAIKGFDFVKDNVIGHPSKELLEGEWIRSEYGNPPVTISTPKVLKRRQMQLPPEAQGQVEMTTFGYGGILEDFAILVNNSQFPPQTEIDVEKAVEGFANTLEARGAKNLIVKNEEFKTPNGAEGLKTFGTGEFPEITGKGYRKGEYILLTFVAKGVMQQITVLWEEGDNYAEQMADRIIGSVELQKATN